MDIAFGASKSASLARCSVPRCNTTKTRGQAHHSQCIRLQSIRCLPTSGAGSRSNPEDASASRSASSEQPNLPEGIALPQEEVQEQAGGAGGNNDSISGGGPGGGGSSGGAGGGDSGGSNPGPPAQNAGAFQVLVTLAAGGMWAVRAVRRQERLRQMKAEREDELQFNEMLEGAQGRGSKIVPLPKKK